MSLANSAALAAQGERSGKFRHIFGQAWKDSFHYTHLDVNFSGESSCVSASTDYCACSRNGAGGSVYIFKIGAGHRAEKADPVLNVHNRRVLDTQWSPFHADMVCTASDDKTLCVSKIPPAMDTTITTPGMRLQEHTARVQLCAFHPCAENVLASVSMDKSVKLWDIGSGKCLSSYTDVESNYAYSLEWNANGSLLGMTHRDKMLRMVDPRAPNTSLICESFSTAKASKMFWMPNLNWVGMTGFSGVNRSLKFYDLKNLERPLFEGTIDKTSAVLMPYFDADLGVLYLAGKGDSSVMFGEVINNKKKWYQLGSYKDSVPQKGGCWLPKRVMKVMDCEVNRFLKLSKNRIIPMTFTVPRKNLTTFQSDIFPNCVAGQPSLNCDEWFNQKMNKPAVRCSMDSRHSNLANNSNESKQQDAQPPQQKVVVTETKTVAKADEADDVKVAAKSNINVSNAPVVNTKANVENDRTPTGASVSDRMAIFKSKMNANFNNVETRQTSRSTVTKTKNATITIPQSEYLELKNENQRLKAENEKLKVEIEKLQQDNQADKKEQVDEN